MSCSDWTPMDVELDGLLNERSGYLKLRNAHFMPIMNNYLVGQRDIAIEKLLENISISAMLDGLKK